MRPVKMARCIAEEGDQERKVGETDERGDLLVSVDIYQIDNSDSRREMVDEDGCER